MSKVIDITNHQRKEKQFFEFIKKYDPVRIIGLLVGLIVCGFIFFPRQSTIVLIALFALAGLYIYKKF